MKIKFSVESLMQISILHMAAYSHLPAVVGVFALAEQTAKISSQQTVHLRVVSIRAMFAGVVQGRELNVVRRETI